MWTSKSISTLWILESDLSFADGPSRPHGFSIATRIGRALLRLRMPQSKAQRRRLRTPKCLVHTLEDATIDSHRY